LSLEQNAKLAHCIIRYVDHRSYEIIASLGQVKPARCCGGTCFRASCHEKGEKACCAHGMQKHVLRGLPRFSFAIANPNSKIQY
jgi:hypothetical protein